MVQAGWRHKYGGEICVARSRSSRTTFDSVTKKITNGQRYVAPWDESLPLCAAAVQRPTECRHDATARTCSDPGFRWAEPNFPSDVNRTLLVAADTLRNASSQGAAAAEVVGNTFDLGGEQREYFDLKEDGPVPKDEGEVEPDAAPRLSEFEQQTKAVRNSRRVFNW